MMKKRPLFWFYALAFGLAWLGWLPTVLHSRGLGLFASPVFSALLLLPALSPALAARLVTHALHGREAVSRLFVSLLNWRETALLYLAALGAPAVLLLAAQRLTQSLSLAVPLPAAGDLWSVLAPALLISALSNPWEEVGWRGFALPRLQVHLTALQSSLVGGLLWGLWHLPLFFWVGNPMAGYPFLPWLIGTLALAVIYTCLYNSARGSLLPVALFHVAFNTWGVVIPGVSTLALAGVQVLAAAALTALFGSAHLAKQPRIISSG